MDQKYIKLQVTNEHNEILEESEVVLNSGDILVAQVPKETTREQARRLHDGISLALSGKNDSIIISENVKLLVIKKN